MKSALLYEYLIRIIIIFFYFDYYIYYHSYL